MSRRARMIRARVAAVSVVVACAAAVATTTQPTPQTVALMTPAPPPPPHLTVAWGEAEAPSLTAPALDDQRLVQAGRGADSGFGGLAVRWSEATGVPAFTAQVTAVVRAAIASHAELTGQPYAPSPHDGSLDLRERGCAPGATRGAAPDLLARTPGIGVDAPALVVDCEVVVAAGPYLGERLRAVVGTPQDVVSDEVHVIFANADTGEAVDGAQLWTPEGVAALARAVTDAQAAAEAQVAAPESPDAWADVAITLAGGMEVHLATDAGPLTVRVPPELVAGMVTPWAADMVAAVRTHREWSGPVPVASGLASVDCTLVPCVALTFDDGPSELTPGLLDTFASRPHAAATFFVLGARVAGREATLARAVAEGNEVENHTWSHSSLTGMTDAEIQAEIGSTTAVIEAATGVPVRWVRPPYGAMNAHVRAVAGAPFMLWTVDTNDWQRPGEDALVQQVVWGSRPDDVVLMHDIHAQTVAAVPAMVDGLLMRGFTLVTVGQLLGGHTAAPGEFVWSLEAVATVRATP